MPSLAIYLGDVLDQQVPLRARGPALRVGRAGRNDVVLRDPGAMVSREHAVIRSADGTFMVHDVGSENGLWVDGRRVPSAELRLDVPIVIGPYRLLLDPADVEETTAEHPPAGAVESPTTSGQPRAAGVAVGSPAPTRSPGTPPGGRRAPVSVGLVFGILAGVVGGGLGVMAVQSWLSGPTPETTVVQATTTSTIPASTVEATSTIPADSTTTTTSSVPGPQPGQPGQPPYLVGQRPGERRQQRLERSWAMYKRYQSAVAAAERGDYDAAIALFDGIQGEEFGYADVVQRVSDARERRRQARALDGQARMAAAREAESRQEFAEAERLYQEARALDPSLAASVATALDRVARDRLARATQAAREAKQQYAVGNYTRARVEYEKVVRFAPAGHPLAVDAAAQLKAIQAQER